MALTDWTQQQDASAQGATSAQADTGSKSYEMDGSSSTPIITLDQSETDSPSEGKVKTQIYFDGGGNSQPGALFRYQDTNNYYHVQMDNSGAQILLESVDGGSSTVHDSASTSSNSTGSWTSAEFIVWENGGNFNARVKRGGSQIGTDLSDSNNKFSGGGIGMIESKADSVFWDETEVFY